MEGHVIVEVKVWQRNDFRDITAQLQSYALVPTPQDGSTLALIAVMVADIAVDAPAYTREVHGASALAASASAEWRGEVEGPDMRKISLRHFLVSGLRRAR